LFKELTHKTFAVSREGRSIVLGRPGSSGDSAEDLGESNIEGIAAGRGILGSMREL
jgi:hypothetical protein